MNVTTTDEKSLVLALQLGSHSAFEKLYHIHSNKIFWKLSRLVKDKHQAEEMLQDLFVRVWEKKSQVNADYPFAAFLTTITKNMVVDHHRKLARFYVAQKELQLTTSELSSVTEETLISRETEELLQKALSQLPEQRRVAFKLCKLEGKSHKEAAEIMGISHNTVHNHLVKATRSLRLALEPVEMLKPTLLLAVLVSMY